MKVALVRVAASMDLEKVAVMAASRATLLAAFVG